MTKCLIAEFQTKPAAKLALELLESNQFTLKHVSVIASADDPAAEHLHQLHAEEGSGSSSHATPENRGTSLGMLIGGTAAAPIAAGTLIGPFIIAGPLIGMAVGAAIGSLISMEPWGVTQDATTDYEQRVKAGSVLVVVHDVADDRLSTAQSLLQTTAPLSLEKYEVS